MSTTDALDSLAVDRFGTDQRASRNPPKELWQSVVVLAVIEALDKRSGSSEANARNAQQWIFEESSFEEVCDLADLDAGWIRRQVRKKRDEQQAAAPLANNAFAAQPRAPT